MGNDFNQIHTMFIFTAAHSMYWESECTRETRLTESVFQRRDRALKAASVTENRDHANQQGWGYLNLCLSLGFAWPEQTKKSRRKLDKVQTEALVATIWPEEWTLHPGPPLRHFQLKTTPSSRSRAGYFDFENHSRARSRYQNPRPRCSRHLWAGGG